MAGGLDLGTPSGRGKRPLDATINLVPFIDLMAVTISFLVLTAVWVQAGSLEVTTAEVKDGERVPVHGPAAVLTLVLTPRELRFASGPSQAPLELSAGGSERFREQLRAAQRALGDEVAVSLLVDDGVRYEDMVRVIDSCVGVGLSNVNVEAQGGEAGEG